MRLKEQHECAIGHKLLKALECEGEFHRHGKDDGEPDLIYSVDGRTIGIEIATAYLGGDAAKVDWDLARGKSQWGVISLFKSDERILSNVQRVLDEKCLRTYSGANAVWLCIQAHDPAASVWQIEQLVKSLSVPHNTYERIYIAFHALPDDGGEFSVYQLV